MACAIVEAYGEKKQVWEWARDNRCLVEEREMIRRLGRGWPADRAMGDKQVKRTAEELHDAAMARETQRPKIMLWPGFGEEKSCPVWSKDPRCNVSLAELRRRLMDGIPVSA